MLTRPAELKITDPRAIKLLETEKSFSMLQPFSLEPCSLKQASEQLNISISNYLYWINRFLEAGLILIAYNKKRLGSSIKYYWMVADKLTISLSKKPDMLEDCYMRLFKKNNIATTQSISSLVEDLDLNLVIDISPNKNAKLYSSSISNKKKYAN